MVTKTSIVPIKRIEKCIYVLRGQRVMLDSDLALLYGVSTSRLNEQVKRNIDRFPQDFMFQLKPDEVELLRSQNAISNKKWGGRRYLPNAFTEHGAMMLTNVLKSPVAIDASIQVVRAFVRLRKMLMTHEDLARKLEHLEQKYDKQFAVVFQAIRELMTVPEGKDKQRQIGFGQRK